MDQQQAAGAFTRLFDVLLPEENPSTILDSLARIVGEALEVDRSLIYDISFATQEAVALTEWLNPQRPEITATKATYPLQLFASAAKVAFESRAPIASHHDQPHPAMIADGSAALLHGGMKIQSLLWFPFSFRADGFYLLVFNHVGETHRWQPAELEFMAAATRYVSMALLKIDLLRERTRAEERLFQGQKLESLGMLAGGVAHDFNNLMVGVITNSDLLLRRLDANSEVRTLVQRIQQAGERAASLAGQLLAYAGKGQTDIVRVNLAEVVDTTIKLVRSSLSDVEITVAVADAVPPIECAVAQLEQVIMNLVVNAAEACTTGGHVTIRIGALVLDDASTAGFETPARPSPGTYVSMTVSDTGSGIDAATMQRIFDPFFTTKRTGRGLGLSAVLGILKHHRGAIRIDSSPETGTTFTILWPASASAGVAPAPPAEVRPSDGAGKQVLCIDDEVEVATAVCGLLDDAGYRCITAIGGREGIARFAEHAREIDAVVLDLTMPHLGGREVLRELRAVRADVPIVLMSGFTADDTIEDLTDARTRFIRKPFLGDALLAVVRRVLSTTDQLTAPE